MITWLKRMFGDTENGGLNEESHDSQANLTGYETLLAHVRLAINPRFQDWVLFKNGTYVIFDATTSIAHIQEAATVAMKEYGPVFIGGPAGDFEVTYLDETEGWVVAGHGYGMYTYVHPSELNSTEPTDLEVGLYGRTKRDLDGRNPQILHVNTKG